MKFLPKPTLPGAVLASGVVAAALLLASASLDLGDPLAAARARAVASAEAELERAGKSVEAALRGGPDRLLRYANLESIESLPSLARLERWAVPGPGEEVSSLSATAALVESAELAGARGQLADGIAAAREALRLAETPAERALAHLAAVRLWSELGEADEVRRHRSAMFAEDAAPKVDGTSAKLLACLADPVDVEGAFSAIARDPGLALPLPQDSVEVVGGAFSTTRDPWWEAVRAQLVRAGADPDLLSERLDDRERFALACHRWSDLNFGALEDRPGFRAGTFDGGRTVVLAHGAERATSFFFFTPAAAWRALTEHDLEGERDVLTAGGLGSAEDWNIETLAGPLQVDGLPGGYYAGLPDPEASGRAEAARQRDVRIGLLLLATAILAASVAGSRALARARRLAIQRRTFVASVSHDLRTPVQGILLMAESLEEGRLEKRSPERTRQYHGRIRREAQRLRRLVEDLLDGARIDRGEGARVEREDIETARWLDELQRAMDERAGAAGAELTLDLGDLPARLFMDPLGVHRAIWNVYENAVLHGASADGVARIRVRVEADADELVVTIQDQGPGIPAARRAAAFRPFERLAGARGTRANPDRDTGTGLGLAIVRSICRAHGGEATVEDGAPGARFILRFGLTPTELAAEVAAQ